MVVIKLQNNKLKKKESIMLKLIKKIFVSKKDHNGRSIENVINTLARQTNSHSFAWSYLADEKLYENTMTGMRVYQHELSKTAA